jgi:glycosyltransferase involved in cell wall biosynthesis
VPATILLVTDNTFWVRRDGTEERLSRLHDDLVRDGFSVAVFYVGALKPKDRALIRQMHIHILEDRWPASLSWITHTPLLGRLAQSWIHTIGRVVRKRRWQRKTPRGRIPHLADFQNSFAKRKFGEYLQRIHPDVVLIVKVHLAYLVADIPKRDHRRPMLVIDTNDVMHLRAQTFSRNGQQHWLAISREEECQVLSRFDIIMAIQSQEAAIFREMLPGVPVVVTPLSVTVGRRARLVSSDRIRLGYLGSGGPSNLLALQQFIPRVFTALRKRFGAAVEFHIAGKVCEKLAESGLSGVEGITLAGLVESSDDFWDSVDIAVNPVFFGGGLKIKNVEALSRGCALVTTSIGAQGMEQGADQAFLIADTHESQLAAISTLVEDANLRRGLSVQSRAFAESHFSSKQALAELCAAIATRIRAG